MSLDFDSLQAAFFDADDEDSYHMIPYLKVNEKRFGETKALQLNTLSSEARQQY